MQHLLTAMADQPERVDQLFAWIGEFEFGIARRYLELGVEAAWISDDYGMNSALDVLAADVAPIHAASPQGRHRLLP